MRVKPHISFLLYLLPLILLLLLGSQYQKRHGEITTESQSRSYTELLKLSSLRTLLRSLPRYCTGESNTYINTMAWRSSGGSNGELVENLARHGLVKSALVRSAMEKVDRAQFCSDPTYAYEDSPQSIGHAATISAPHMHASAAEALLPYVKPGSRVLDIGSGSGYLTAVFAELVHPKAAGDESDNGGRVVGMEHIKALRDLGEGNYAKSARGREMLEAKRVQFVVGDGRRGWAEGEDGGKGWDAIHVGAAADELHPQLVEQLRRPGRMFIPVEGPMGQHIWVVDKDEDGEVRKEKHYAVRYVPLTDPPKS